ncbi:AAA family ATPase [Synechocystis sp. FACHB-383]|uniref:ATP-dependent nuclease n=1 Tax=Synechocystis sp. FACHB-383 TaxID=2692864 RepID=UPI00168306C4|nr:AAA family ATPase [Synechocystis sp. FACHB-383]MBD2652777.1 AAA family ATPase [Synechocystis sp. FACHB-383]
MKLCRIGIKRFRSIEKCDLRIESVCALVGENNVGKSSLLRALNAFFNLDEEKAFFYNSSHEYSNRSQSCIMLTFSDLPNDEDIQSASHTGYLKIELKYLPKTKNFTLSYKNPNPTSIGLDFIEKIKKHVDFVFIPPTRSKEELKWQEEKAIKRVVSALLNDKFKTRDTVTPKFSHAADYLQKNALKQISNKLNDYYGDRSELDFDLRFSSNIHFSDFLSSLEFSITENGSEHRIDDCGNGVQSLTIIALYRMLGSLNSANIIIGIEEPETNLHPQSQRQLVKRILTPGQNSFESQVVFTTHSTVIIDSLGHENIILFRKKEDTSRGFKTELSHVRDDFWVHYGIEELKYYKFHNYRNSDFFYSRLIIVVESSTDAGVVKQLLLQRNVDIDDYPVSILNLDGINNLKYPLFLLNDLKLKYVLIVDKDFFVPYSNGELKTSRYGNGFPKYANNYSDEGLIEHIIPNRSDRSNLLLLLRNNHSRALDLLERYNVICMKYNLETDLVASDTATQLFYSKLNIPVACQNKYELLVNRHKQIKCPEHLTHVVANTPHRNLPNSFKRIKNVLERLIKETVGE